jgi:putative transposase
MYDYRRMTAEQKQGVVEARRARGFPLHKPPHLTLGEGWYLISAATYEHRQHFRTPAELSALGQRVMETLAQVRSRPAGWVVMPNHYHVLLHAAELPNLGRALGAVHGRSARYANQRDGTPGRQVWYKYSDRSVRSERHFWTCLHYIIANPVKHGYAKTVADWPWSCVHELVVQRGSTWVEDLQRDYPLRDFGRGWDD